jgi:hypothetical protein
LPRGGVNLVRPATVAINPNDYLQTEFLQMINKAQKIYKTKKGKKDG